MLNPSHSETIRGHIREREEKDAQDRLARAEAGLDEERRKFEALEHDWLALEEERLELLHDAVSEMQYSSKPGIFDSGCVTSNAHKIRRLAELVPDVFEIIEDDGQRSVTGRYKEQKETDDGSNTD